MKRANFQCQTYLNLNLFFYFWEPIKNSFIAIERLLEMQASAMQLGQSFQGGF